MRRPRTHACIVASLLAIAGAGCSSDQGASTATAADTTADAESTASSAAAAAGPTLSPGVVPAAATDLTAAADVRALLTSIGFPTAWPMPDGLAADAVLGLEAGQSAGESGTDATFSLTWSAPTADLDATAKQWFDAADAALGVGPQIGTSTVGSGASAGVSYSGGSEDDPNGSLTVTVSPVDAATIAVQVEYEVVIAGEPTLQFAPSTLAGLPSIVGCRPELVQVSLVRYDAPNASAGERDYTSIFQGTCPSRATFDSTVSWAVGRDGIITQDADSIEVTDTTGPDGESLHVGASASGSLRIDTKAAVDAG